METMVSEWVREVEERGVVIVDDENGRALLPRKNKISHLEKRAQRAYSKTKKKSHDCLSKH